MLAIVKYQVATYSGDATYSGEIHVLYNENDEDEHIIAKAKRLLERRTGSLPYGYQIWMIIDRVEN